MPETIHVEELRGAAEGSDVASMTALGTLLLTGRDAPFEPEEGARLVASAAERGDAQAMSVMATLKGAGAWTSQRWSDALALLERAAEAGAVDAREQLVPIAGDQSLADRARRGENIPQLWRRLRDSVNLEQWILPPASRQVWDWPKIWTAENFTTPELGAWLVSRAKDKLRPSMMFNGQRPLFLASRTCSDFAFTLVDGGVVLL